jgi:ketopantoate reductase
VAAELRSLLGEFLAVAPASAVSVLERQSGGGGGCALCGAVGVVGGVARLTAENRSSMLRDVESGRRTENHFITGALLREAQRRGLTLPTHQRLFQQIDALDRAAVCLAPTNE